MNFEEELMYDEMYEADGGIDLTEYEVLNDEYKEEMCYD